MDEKRRMRKNIMIDPKLDSFVKETAGRYKVSESRVIEKALAKLQAEEERETLPLFFDYAGALDCEHTDLSSSYKTRTARRNK